MKLNHFVFESNNQLVNITTKKTLPKNSSFEDLKQNFFLEGQEQESINKALFSVVPRSISLKIIPTWECNLRCNHCFVLHRLLKEDKRQIDVDLLVSFINSYLSKYTGVDIIYVTFIGGEPSIKSDFNLGLIKKVKESFPNKKFFSSCTSNGLELNEKSIEFFSELTHFTISIDGSKESHDRQRKSFDKSIKSPFDLTLSNLKKLISLGMRDKVYVQASLLPADMNEDNVLDFYKHILMCGVKYENILFGCTAPTRQRDEPDSNFLNACKTPHIRPCCKYRLMKDFVIDTSNNVYCDYFNPNEDNLLGTLSDSIEKIAEKHKEIISLSMPVLNDPKCQSCPVIGLCWGWCCNTVGLLNPSDYCDQEGLIQKAQINAKAGTLIDLVTKGKSSDATIKCS